MVDSKENYKFDLGVKGLMKEWKMNERKKKNPASQTCTPGSKKVFALSSNELLAIFCLLWYIIEITLVMVLRHSVEKRAIEK